MNNIMARNKDGDITGLISVKPPTAPRIGYQDTLMTSEFLKKADADLLESIIDTRIDESDRELETV